MLTSTKLILGGFLGMLACFALVLIGAIAGNRGAVSVTVTLLGVAALAASFSPLPCSRPP